MAYRLQFFRQWLRDIGAEDIRVEDSLDHAKTIAQVTLESLARERTSRLRPRTAYVIDEESHTLVVAYRLTDAGPVELPPVSPATTASHRLRTRLRLVREAAGLRS